MGILSILCPFQHTSFLTKQKLSKEVIIKEVKEGS